MFQFTLPLQFTFIEIFHFENIDVLIKKKSKSANSKVEERRSKVEMIKKKQL